ncbi:MAG: hypothetical protein ACI4WU_04880 [Bacilli bacterium]
MKVSELLEILKTVDGNMNVYAVYSGDNLLNDSELVSDVIQVKYSKIESNNGIYLRIGE